MILISESIQNQVWDILREVPDPEIPVLSVIDLGIIRSVDYGNNGLIVTITPTYSGCPAMGTFEEDIKNKLKENGFSNVEVETVYKPAWTTDWISEEGLLKLKEYGIAPPEKTLSGKAELLRNKSIACPRCDSKDARLVSEFGSTACKALYQCNECQEPFDYFKCI